MTRTKIVALVVCLVLTTAVLAVSTAKAADFRAQEVGSSVFYGWSSDLDNENTLYMAGFMGSAAWHLYQGGWARLDLRVEGELAYFWDYDTGWEFAVLPGLRLYLGDYTLKPYLEGGVGPSFNSLSIEELGTAFNFVSYGGAGLRLGLSDGASVEMGYRFRHISNAGIDERNSGVNHHVIMLGMAWNY